MEEAAASVALCAGTGELGLPPHLSSSFACAVGPPLGGLGWELAAHPGLPLSLMRLEGAGSAQAPRAPQELHGLLR